MSRRCCGGAIATSRINRVSDNRRQCTVETSHATQAAGAGRCERTYRHRAGIQRDSIQRSDLSQRRMTLSAGGLLQRRIAVGSAIRLHHPTGLGGQSAQDIIHIRPGGEVVVAILAQAGEDLGGDGTAMAFADLGFLLVFFAGNLGLTAAFVEGMRFSIFKLFILLVVFFVHEGSRGVVHYRRAEEEEGDGEGEVEAIAREALVSVRKEWRKEK